MTTASAPVIVQDAPRAPIKGYRRSNPVTAIGKLLDALLASRGYSQAELARRAGVTQGIVSRLRSGERTPSRDLVEAIADALDASPLERFDLLVAGGYLPDDAQHFLTYWSRVPLATRIELTNLVMAIAEDRR